MNAKAEVPKYDRLVKMLAFVARDGSYVVIDRIARAHDRDLVEQSIYEALRYIAPDLRKCNEWERKRKSLSEEEEIKEEEKKKCENIRSLLGDFTIPEDEINALLEDIEKGRLSVARRIAIKALAKALSIPLDTEDKKTPTPAKTK
ncbi:MAG: hypothetical protein QXY82_04090 [Desulfurococcaceae archaeon]